jgi:hypothetical protein
VEEGGYTLVLAGRTPCVMRVRVEGDDLRVEIAQGTRLVSWRRTKDREARPLFDEAAQAFLGSMEPGSVDRRGLRRFRMDVKAAIERLRVRTKYGEESDWHRSALLPHFLQVEADLQDLETGAGSRFWREGGPSSPVSEVD